jgi:hypothetical protein
MVAQHWAERLNSRSTIVALLICSGADVKQVASAFNGKTLLTTALEQCNEATAQPLLDTSAHYDSLCLREAVGQGVYSSATVTNVRLDTSDEHFQCTCCGNVTALMVAQEVATVKLALAAGASARTSNNRGNACFHVAAAHKHPAPVICLLIKAAGADITAVNNDGMTAAEVAHEHGNLLVEALLKRAAEG